MNSDVLDEQLLNPCWLSCSLPLVVLIHVSELLYKSNILCIDYTSGHKRWVEDPWKFGRFKVENQKTHSTCPVAPRLPTPLKTKYVPQAVTHHPECLKVVSIRQDLMPRAF